ncbi:hypothetical protein EDI_044540 [Entamoeba dispar SAW760]|uniref:Tyrosine-protein kinase ephrin type A/B receptor-like domain-containing protein n=1 Tax=Entamoeba dispar (strain ATCC PRA-260 / SAW760) TaxID=370354 RepID=B0EHV4_ENTDS|nr:uncharacterized protein EDI_044540 [Entamoeba dispar SAW760]EDR25898.1 hypothetical protein EDI_044540 [Entamoeba dispar SAW760]|eukprot:EDR25898.1 hypothetical protein EDI_044540 [Entamoeba dispar SAW760]
MIIYLIICFSCIAFAEQYTMVGTNSNFLEMNNWNPQHSGDFTTSDDLILPIDGFFSVSSLRVNKIIVSADIDLSVGVLIVNDIEDINNKTFIVRGLTTITGSCSGIVKMRSLKGTVTNNGYLLVQATESLVVVNYGTLELGNFESGDYSIFTMDVESYGDIIYSKPIYESNYFNCFGGSISFETKLLPIVVNLKDTRILTNMEITVKSTINNCTGKELSIKGESVTITNSKFTNVEVVDTSLNSWNLECTSLFLLQTTRTQKNEIKDSIISSQNVEIKGNWNIVNSQIGRFTKISNAQIVMDDHSLFFGILSMELTTINQIFYNGTDLTTKSCVIDYVKCTSTFNYISTTINNLECHKGCILEFISVTSLHIYNKECSIKTLRAQNIIGYTDEWILPSDLTVSKSIDCHSILVCSSTCSFVSTASSVSDLIFKEGQILLSFSGCSIVNIFSNSETIIKSVLQSTTDLYLTIKNNILTCESIIKNLVAINSSVTSYGNIETLKGIKSTFSIQNINNNIILDEIVDCQFTTKITVISGTPVIHGSSFVFLSISSSSLIIENSTITSTLELFSTTITGSCTTNSFIFDDVLMNRFIMKLSSCLSKYTATRLNSIESSFIIPCITRLSTIDNELNVDLILTGDSYIGYGTTLMSKTITNNGLLKNYGTLNVSEFISCSENSQMLGNGEIICEQAVVNSLSENTIKTTILNITKDDIILNKVTFNENGQLNQNRHNITIKELKIENGLTIKKTSGFIENHLLVGSGKIFGDLVTLNSFEAILTSVYSIDIHNVRSSAEITDCFIDTLNINKANVQITSSIFNSLYSISSNISINGKIRIGTLQLYETEIEESGETNIVEINYFLNGFSIINVPISITSRIEGTFTFKKPVKLINIHSPKKYEITSESLLECEGSIDSFSFKIINKGTMLISENCQISVILDNKKELIAQNTKIIRTTIINDGIATFVNVTAPLTSITSSSSMSVSCISELNNIHLLTGSITNMKGDVSTSSFLCEGTYSVDTNATLNFTISSVKKCIINFPKPVHHLHLTNPTKTIPYFISVTPNKLPLVGDSFYLISCDNQPFPDKPSSEVSGVDRLALSRELDSNSYNISITKCPSGSSYILSCIECKEGEYQIEDECYRCPPGTYSDKYNCIPCPEGTYSILSSSSCPVCGNGMWSYISSSGCYSCKSGYYKNSTIGCVPCIQNTWSSEGADECIECDKGMVTMDHITCVKNKTNSSDCEDGYYFNNSECIECENGYVELNKCIQCNDDEELNEEKTACIFYSKKQWIVYLLSFLIFAIVLIIFVLMLAFHILNYYKEKRRESEQKKFIEEMFTVQKSPSEEDDISVKYMTPDEWLYPDSSITVNGNFDTLNKISEDKFLERYQLYRTNQMSEKQKQEFKNEIEIKEQKMKDYCYKSNNGNNKEENNKKNSSTTYNLEIELENENQESKSQEEKEEPIKVTEELQIDLEQKEETVEADQTEKLTELQLESPQPVFQQIKTRNNISSKAEITIALNEINKLKEQYEKDLLNVKSMVRSLTYETNVTKEKLKVLENDKENKNQQELKGRKEATLSRAGIDGGSRVQDILIAGVNPRFIPLPDPNGKSSGYLK